MEYLIVYMVGEPDHLHLVP
ncbi:predicted transporter [Sagittula stellata E-37]|uniref:Predicted transporter n=1 Tax=Sagittula stellata (strain ATCC 700073 / DSM 11524 / E-37) TaxID=388399 RepID=A3K367_SAGS3|nr:predicted transporter [Sagittula stellata E-37]